MFAQSAPRILPTSFTSRRSHANTEKALYYLIAICLQVKELNYFLHILFPFKTSIKIQRSYLLWTPHFPDSFKAYENFIVERTKLPAIQCLFKN